MENSKAPNCNLAESGTRLLSNFNSGSMFYKLGSSIGNVNAIADDADYKQKQNTCNNIASKHESSVADDDSLELNTETNSSNSCLSTVQVGKSPRAKKFKLEFADLSYELQQAFRILKDLMSDAHKGVNQPFMDLIDDRDEELEDYYEVIRKPLWLKKVKEKFLKREYKTITEFVADIRLILENCYRYYGPDSPFTKKALKLEQMLEQKLALLPRDLREKTTLEFTSGQSLDDIIATRRRSTRQSLGYTSILLQQVRHEKALRDRELKKKHSEEKKAVKVEKEKEALEWEDTLLEEPLKTQMKAMWELPLIGHFFYLCQNTLNMPEVSQYELERILVMPRASSLLPKIMTSLLSNPQQRSCLDRKPAMPYKVWHSRLQGRIQSWYKILQAREYRSDLVFQQLGIEANFFKILGPDNPLNDKQFHELTFHQRVWCVKGLCDYILHNHRTIQDAMNEQVIDDMREYILGCDSKGNAYLHFPQFCGQDLRIYRQRKCTKPPSPSYWGAISNKKRKIEDSDNILLQSAKKSKGVELKLNTSDEISFDSIEEKKSVLITSTPNNDSPEQKKEDSPEQKRDDSSEQIKHDSTDLQKDSPCAESKCSTEFLPEDGTPRPNSPPTVSTRRSLRISKAKQELAKMEVDEPCHKKMYNFDEEEENEPLNGVDGNAGENDVDDGNNTESESETEENLKPNIEEFELVVDTVESLRKFMEQFKEKDSPKKGKQSSRRKSEVKLYERLNNLLVELEPWEVKLQKAAQRVRNRLRREWESFEEKEEEIEDIWGSDREETESRPSSGIPSVISSANEGDGTSDEESEIPFKHDQQVDRTKPKLHLAQKVDLSTEALLNQYDDSSDYRTRGRLRQLKHLHTHSEANFARSKNKKFSSAVTVNGSKHDQKLNFLRICSSQNTTLQAKELYAWETLRQILVPPLNCKDSGNVSGRIFPLQNRDISTVQTTLNSSLDKSPTKMVTVSEKHNLLNAKMDMLGAMQAATLMAKKVDVRSCNKDKANLSLTEKQKDGSVSPLNIQNVASKMIMVKNVPASSACAVVASSAATTAEESLENRNLLHTVSLNADVKSDEEFLKSICNIQKSTVMSCTIPSPPLATVTSRTIPTKQQLNDLTSVAENTQNLKKLLQFTNTPSSEKTSKVMLLPMVGPNGKPVVYRMTANNSSSTQGTGKLLMGIKQLGKSLPPSSASTAPTEQAVVKVVSSSSVSSSPLHPTKTVANSFPSNVLQTSPPQIPGMVSSAVKSVPVASMKSVQAPQGIGGRAQHVLAPASAKVSSIKIPSQSKTPIKTSPISANVPPLISSPLNSKRVVTCSPAKPLVDGTAKCELPVNPPSLISQEAKNTQGVITSNTPSKSVSASGQQVLLIPLPSNHGRNLYLQIPAPTTVPSNSSSSSSSIAHNIVNTSVKPTPVIKSPVLSDTQPKEGLPNVVPSNFLTQAISDSSSGSTPATSAHTAVQSSPSKSAISKGQRLIPALSAKKRIPSVGHEVLVSELPPLAPFVNVVRSQTATNVNPLKTVLPSRSQSDLIRSTLIASPCSQATSSSPLVIPSTNKLAHSVKPALGPNQATSSVTSSNSSPSPVHRTTSVIMSSAASSSACHPSPIQPNVMSTTPSITPALTSLSSQKPHTPMFGSFVQSNVVTKSPAKTGPNQTILQTQVSPNKISALVPNSTTSSVKQAAEPTPASSASVSVASLIANNPTLAATIQKYTQSGYRVMISHQGDSVVLHAIPPANSPSVAAKSPAPQGSVMRTSIPVASPQTAQQQLLVTVPSQAVPRLVLQQPVAPVPQTVPQQTVTVIQQVQPQQLPIVATPQSQQVAVSSTPQKMSQQLPIPTSESILQQQAILTSAPPPVCYQNKAVDSLQTVVSELGLAPALPSPATTLIQMTATSPLSAEVNNAVSTQSPLCNLIQNPVSISSVPPAAPPQLSHNMSVNSLATLPSTEAILEQTATTPTPMVTSQSAQPQLVMIRDSSSNKQILGLLLDNGQVIPINANVTFTTTAVS